MSNDIQDKNPNTKQNTNRKYPILSIDFWIAEPVLDTWGRKFFYTLRSWWLCVTIVASFISIYDKFAYKLKEDYYISGFIASFVITFLVAGIIALISKSLIDKNILGNRSIKLLIFLFGITAIFWGTRNIYQADYIRCYHLATQKTEMSKYCKDIATGWHTKVLFLK